METEIRATNLPGGGRKAVNPYSWLVGAKLEKFGSGNTEPSTDSIFSAGHEPTHDTAFGEGHKSNEPSAFGAGHEST